jgi:hypothetical protein
MTQGAAGSNVPSEQGRDFDHGDYERVYHERPGEQERIAFHVHEFDHGCYGRHCPEADRLYAMWHAALVQSPSGHHQ